MDTIYLTQLRAGPKLELGMGENYIPKKMTIAAVIQTQGETLLEWAEKLKGLAPNTAIYHPGGSPADHWFVHARLNEVPVFTTFKPKVGDVITPSEGQVKLDIEWVLKGLVLGANAKLSREDAGSLVIAMLMGLHNSGRLSGESSKWIGVAASLLLRLGSIALRGEARHHHTHKTKQSREALYDRHFNRSLDFHRASLRKVAHLFRYGDWNGSFGGQAWAKCAYSLDPVFSAVRDLCVNRDLKHLNQLIMAVNVAINQAHNNGWWLNKFSSISDATAVAQGQMRTLINASPALWKLNKSYPVGKWDQFIDRWAKWPKCNIPSVGGKLGKMTLKYIPGSGLMVNLGVNKLLKSSSKASFVIGSNIIGDKIGNYLHKLEALSEDGMAQVAADLGDGKKIILWKDSPLGVGTAKQINLNIKELS